jgi:starch synthase (maltosyl-transferring)
MSKEGKQRVIIENVKPQVDGGEFPAKRVIGDTVTIEADIFCDSHDQISAEVLCRHENGRKWRSVDMVPDVNDRWTATFEIEKQGDYLFTLQAWVDKYKSWHHDTLRKLEGDTANDTDLLIGKELILKTMKAYPDMRKRDAEFLEKTAMQLAASTGKTKAKAKAIFKNILLETMVRYPVRSNITKFERVLIIEADREKAAFSSWYEVFPRSLGKAGEHGTFKDCIDFLPRVKALGFDVLYLPPIHPIGVKNRKGKNNNVISQPGEPGSPWAIGGKEGGHKAIHPELGTMTDFKNLVTSAEKMGIEIAMDIAFQCSPDHPYIREHPDWFNSRPDGTLQYAENPPKKYEDIYPLNFETDDWKNLWEELKSIFLHWIKAGVKIFRVDNPHTKSFRFWKWLISEIRKDHLDIIFLAEAFTRPKIMRHLAKSGFNQSYTYFTWRNTKLELTDYCEELVLTEMKDYFRPNFWPNTPDILPFPLQGAEKPAFVSRLILAATLSSNYGIYGPAYELMVNEPAEPGKEEYLNAEKYEIKDWDFNHPGSLSKLITRINTIRYENKALQRMESLQFHPIENESVIAFSKMTTDKKNIILTVVNLDTKQRQSGWVGLPLHDFGLDHENIFEVKDLLSGAVYQWKGEFNFVELDPAIMPAHIFKIKRL